MKNILVISAYKLSPRVIKKFLLNRLDKKKFRITIKNFSNYVYSKKKNFSNIQLNKRYNFAIVLVNISNKNIFKFLKKNKIKSIYFATLAQPTSLTQSDLVFKRYLRAIFSFNKYKHYIKHMFSFLSIKFFKIYHPDYLLMNQKKNYLNYFSTSKPIYVNSPDYDNYLHNKKIKKPNFIPNKKYVVFLADTPWGSHDLGLLNIRHRIKKIEYKEKINNFFKNFEKYFKYKIIISAHPRQTDNDNIYKPRQFIMKDTEQLIKYSQGVICHFSGAISYAVLNHKPICFFYYKDWLQNDYIVNNTKQYTEALSTQANIIDDNFDYKKLNFYYNKKSFNKYIQKYLKCYTKKTSSYWSGIFKEIKKNEI